MTKSPPHRVAAGVTLMLAALLTACGASPAGTVTVPAVFTEASIGATLPVATEVPATLASATEVSTVETAPAAVDEATETVSSSEPIVVKFNLNTAGPTEFLTIPGVGNRMVREFEEYRPYTSILQFRREIGKYVDATQVAEFEQYLFVPVDINAADADTLKQLPGVDDAIAAELIAARPYADNDAFLTALSDRLNPEQLAVASIYLTMP